MAERQLAHTPYQSVLDQYSSSELTDLERAVHDTMNTRGWVVLEELWKARDLSLTDKLLSIPAGAEAEKYAAAVAHVKGLREAREAPHALAKVAEDKRQEATNE